jgi:hypothetical protein
MKRFVCAAAGFVMAAAMTLFVNGSASASDANFPGMAGYLNLWDDTGYRDTFRARQFDDPDFHTSSFNDKTSSVINKTDIYWLLYDDTFYRDRAMCVSPHSHYSRLADAGFNDKTSSVRFGTTSANSCLGFPIIGIFN